MVSRRETRSEVGKFFLDVTDLHLIEVAGSFFAVAGDEGDGAAFVKQLDDGDEAGHGKVEGAGDVQQDFGGKSFCVGHKCFVYRSGKGSGKPSRPCWLALPAAVQLCSPLGRQGLFRQLDTRRVPLSDSFPSNLSV